MSIILASGSPRRRELLEMLGIRDLLIIPALGEEKKDPALEPGELVKGLALAKAAEVAAGRAADDVIIAADTVVLHEKKVYGKPKSEDEAFKMLKTLSGQYHEVYTGVAIIKGSSILTDFEVTRVHFRELTDSEISAYIATGEPMDKAGSYGAQGLGCLFVDRIDGDFFNVMGLPVCKMGLMLKKQGVELL